MGPMKHEFAATLLIPLQDLLLCGKSAGIHAFREPAVLLSSPGALHILLNCCTGGRIARVICRSGRGKASRPLG